jgi:hypothetical protein
VASFSWQETRAVGRWIQGCDLLFANLKTHLCILGVLLGGRACIPQGQGSGWVGVLAESAGKMARALICPFLLRERIYRQKAPHDPAKIAREDVFYPPFFAETQDVFL